MRVRSCQAMPRGRAMPVSAHISPWIHLRGRPPANPDTNPPGSAVLFTNTLGENPPRQSHPTAAVPIVLPLESTPNDAFQIMSICWRPAKGRRLEPIVAVLPRPPRARYYFVPVN